MAKNKHKPVNKNQERISKIIVKTYENEQAAAALLVQVDEGKKEIQKYFDEQSYNSLSVKVSAGKTLSKSLNLRAKISERVTINYDVDELKKALDSEIFNEVTHKRYEINDIDGLIKLLKSAGIKASEFKQFINPVITVDKEAVKRLYNQGDITMKDIKGCYSAKISKSVKITEDSGD